MSADPSVRRQQAIDLRAPLPFDRQYAVGLVYPIRHLANVGSAIGVNRAHHQKHCKATVNVPEVGAVSFEVDQGRYIH